MTIPDSSTDPFLQALYGVACGSRTSCFAVGDYDDAIAPAVEHWDGKSWSLMTTPTRAGGAISLAAVACAKPTACFAVGGSDPGRAHPTEPCGAVRMNNEDERQYGYIETDAGAVLSQLA